jgi:hypothetical protein
MYDNHELAETEGQEEEGGDHITKISFIVILKHGNKHKISANVIRDSIKDRWSQQGLALKEIIRYLIYESIRLDYYYKPIPFLSLTFH